jgi:MinD superfamily P-loop ATPase
MIMGNERSMKHLVVLSGKGGTGKTTLTAAFSRLARNIVITDCDVDAADLFILLKPELKIESPFYGGKKSFINTKQCRFCGLCMDVCRFDAIENFIVDAVQCEGCGFCVRVCPAHAIEFTTVVTGAIYDGTVADGTEFLHAALLPGEGNSGKLVTELKKKTSVYATGDTPKVVLIDGPPGIGCPVNASLSGADAAVLITEPTLSGLHDLKRIVTLIRSFQIHISVVINKYDLNEAMTEAIESYAKTEKIFVAGRIPFDEHVVRALQQERNIMDFPETPAARAITAIFHSL